MKICIYITRYSYVKIDILLALLCSLGKKDKNEIYLFIKTETKEITLRKARDIMMGLLKKGIEFNFMEMVVSDSEKSISCGNIKIPDTILQRTEEYGIELLIIDTNTPIPHIQIIKCEDLIKKSKILTGNRRIESTLIS